MITYMAFKSKAPNAKALTEMICQIRCRARTFITRMVALSSSRVFGDSFHCSPFSGFSNSLVGSRRNFPNPNTTKLAKDGEAHLALLPSVERNQVSRLKASSNSPGLAQELMNYKVKNVGKTDGGQDLFGEMKQRFLNFKEQKYKKELEHFQSLAEVQYPKFMVIACADSRVCPSNILGFQPGEAFMIRNIANLVPPLENGPSETNAALEFAVNTLEVGNILVIGHSSCAGIQTLMSMQDDVNSRNFIEKWVIKGKVAKLRTKADAAHSSFDQQCRHCEKESINRSLLNLLTYPWIQERVRKELLSIHGGYYDFLNCTFEKWTLDLKGSSLVGQIGGGFSHESEHDLALMVSDFLENGSGGAESRCSSDSDSALSDLAHLAEKILFCKLPVAQYESDLLSVVNSLILSINETDLQFVKSAACNASCIRFSLVKLLRRSGYDAAICATKWQGGGKVPGGDHEYIDVVNYNSNGTSERLIIDIDFRSHFEIARAVDSYDRILNSLPVIYVGSLSRLKQILQIMVEAARSSLKQNSMPLPPWRSLAYLQAKWQSPYERQFNPDGQKIMKTSFVDHKQCNGHLKRLQSSLQSEMEAERLLKPMNSDNNWRLKPERRRHSLFRNL